MDISLATLLAILFGITGTVLATATLFLLLWQVSRLRENQLMALYAVSVVVWTGGNVLLRFLAPFDGNVILAVSYASTLGAVLSGGLLLVYVTYRAGLWMQLRVRIGLVIVGLFCLAVLGLTVLGGLYSISQVTAEGFVELDFDPPGYLALAGAGALYLLSAAVFWWTRAERMERFLAGAGLGFVAVVSIAFPPLRAMGLDSIAVGVATMLFSSGTLRDQVSSRLSELNRQLSDNERRLRAMMTNAPVILWAVDRRSTITLLEGRGLESWDIQADQYMGKPIAELFPDLSEFQESARRVLAGEELSALLNTPKGTYETKYTPLRSAGGEVIGAIGIFFDITDHKRTEVALRRSEDRYRRVLQSIEDGYYEVDLVSNVLLCNTAFCDIVGYTRQEVIGSSTSMWLDEQNKEREFQVFTEVYKTARPARGLEIDITRKDGSRRTVEFTASLVRDEAGLLVGFRGIIRDITERRLADESLNTRVQQMAVLRQVDEELSETLDIRQVLALALDAAMRLSSARAGYIGVVENNMIHVVQVIGNYPETLATSFLSLEAGIVGRVIRNQRAEWVEDVSGDPDYQQYLAETKAKMVIPLISRDRAIGVVNLETNKPERFTQDIFEFLQLVTARIAIAVDNAQLHRQTQSQLEELRELYSHVSHLESLKTEMIRIASHDLRTPMGTVTGYLALLRNDIFDQMGDQQKEFFDAIERGVKRMQTITEDILSVERIEQVARGDSHIVINLHSLVERAFRESEEHALLKSQALTYEADLSPIMVEGDPVQLREAVSNLISNAIKYTPEKGRIAVRLTSNAGSARLEVEDSGYGIPEDQQEQLFQPFFRAKSAETHEIEGTGLGLHLVKSIVERHRGAMIFHSVYGEGSTFGFELPVIKPS